MRTILLYISIIVLASCNSDKKVKVAIDNLTDSYPSLKNSKDSLTNILFIDYKLYKMKFNVFRSGHLENLSYILTVEYENKISAIPIMPLSDSCYWGYENPLTKYDTKKNNFNLQYNKLIASLNINDSLRLAGIPYHVIINNILGWRLVEMNDTAEFFRPCMFADKDSARLSEIRKSNASQIIQLIHPKDYLYEYFASKDSDCKYVFWGKLHRTSIKEKWVFGFKSWSFACPSPPVIEM